MGWVELSAFLKEIIPDLLLYGFIQDDLLQIILSLSFYVMISLQNQ